jgi:hypothetical protein
MIDNDGKCVGGFCDRSAREVAKRAQTQAVDSASVFNAAPVPARARDYAEMCSGTDGRGDCEYKTGHFGPHSPGVPPSDSLGRRLNGLGSAAGIGFQRGASGKMFSRETICAIIRGQMAVTQDSHLRDLLTIFERLE